LQGGFVPSWQMTVVLELSSGTTTVVVFEGGASGTTTVVFAGAGGLLLLMHPDRIGSRINMLAKAFVIVFLW
jgi:hypothetical protein